MTMMSFEESIQKRAFELFLERGGMHGNDQDDWFRAETEVRDKNGRTESKIATNGKAGKKRSMDLKQALGK